MLRSPPKFKTALEIFARHQVDLIVVGGVAAVLAGAPISTFDLEGQGMTVPGSAASTDHSNLSMSAVES